MSDRSTICLFFAGLLLAGIFAAGCTAPGGNTTAAGPEGSGDTITISGAFALYPMMVRWTEEYQKVHPGTRIELSAGGAGKGMTDVLSGMVDLGMVSREISPDEEKKGAVYVAVTKDAVVMTMNRDNPYLAGVAQQGINKSVARAIFVDNTVTTWGEVIGRPEVTDPVHAYTRSDACGAADVFAKYLGGRQEDLKGIGVFGDPGLADAVKNDRLGIGYNNIGFAYDPATTKPLAGLAIVPLDINDNGTVDPDEQVYATITEITSAIDTGKYPSPPARDLYLVAKGNFTGPSKEFVEWILGDGQAFVRESGYIPLPAGRIAEEQAKLA